MLGRSKGLRDFILSKADPTCLGSKIPADNSLHRRFSYWTRHGHLHQLAMQKKKHPAVLPFTVIAQFSNDRIGTPGREPALCANTIASSSSFVVTYDTELVPTALSDHGQPPHVAHTACQAMVCGQHTGSSNSILGLPKMHVKHISMSVYMCLGLCRDHISWLPGYCHLVSQSIGA